MIAAWLQPFGTVSSRLEAAAVGIPRTAGALAGALPIGGAVTGRGLDIGSLGFVAVSVVVVLAIGLLSGLFQGLILRPQVDRAGRWMWTTAGGIALGMLVAGVILALMSAVEWLRPEDFPSAASWGIAGAAVGLVYGASTGAALIRLVRHTPPTASNAA